MPDTPPRPTLPQRVALWILGALMFYIVALYPNLLMARFQPDDVVHYGFLKWMAVVLVLYGVASQLFFTERPLDTRPGRQTLAVTAAILLIIGTFSPIVSFSFVGDVDFFREGYGDGYILLLMAFASLALAVTGRWKQVLVPALGGLAVILWTFLGVQNTISAARTGGVPVLAGNPHEGLAAATMASIQWKWGWILLFAGSGLLVYSAARRDRLEEAPPWETIAGDDEPEPVAAGETADSSAAGQAAVTEAVPEPGAADALETAEAGTVEETAATPATEAAEEEPIAAEAEKTAEAGTAAPATDAAEESAGTTAESPAADEAASASAGDAAAETTAAADASGPEPAATAAGAPAEAGETPSAEDVAAAAEPTPAAEESATAGPSAGAVESAAGETESTAGATGEDEAGSVSAPTGSDAESGSAPATGAAGSSAGETVSAPVETAAGETKEPAASASRPASDAQDER